MDEKTAAVADTRHDDNHEDIHNVNLDPGSKARAQADTQKDISLQSPVKISPCIGSSQDSPAGDSSKHVSSKPAAHRSVDPRGTDDGNNADITSKSHDNSDIHGLPRDKDPIYWSRGKKLTYIALLSFFDGIV